MSGRETCASRLIAVAFITYGLTGHNLSAGTIFAALQMFNVIKYPLQQMGMQLSAIMDCLSALGEPYNQL